MTDISSDLVRSILLQAESRWRSREFGIATALVDAVYAAFDRRAQMGEMSDFELCEAAE